MVGDTLKKQTQELRTYGAGGEAGRQMQATREANTQRMIQGFLSANRKDLIMWLDRHEEINQRTQAPTSILREGDSWNVNMNNQGAGPPQE